MMMLCRVAYECNILFVTNIEIRTYVGTWRRVTCVGWCAVCVRATRRADRAACCREAAAAPASHAHARSTHERDDSVTTDALCVIQNTH